LFSMNIGIIHMGFFYSGGGEKTVLQQAIHLERIGHEVTVYAPIIQKDIFPELQEKVTCVELCDETPKKMPLKTAFSLIWSSIKKIKKNINRNQIFITHGQPSAWIGYRIKKEYKVPYIAYLHQVNRFLKPRKIDEQVGHRTNKNLFALHMLSKNNPIIKELDNISIKKSSMIATNSIWIRKQIKNHYDCDAMVCYPGVDVDEFKPKRKKTDPIILTTNRHYPQKRLDYLISCMTRIVKDVPEVKCFITGKRTHYTKELEILRRKKDLQETVVFTGFLDSHQLVENYQRAATYAFTSPEEDFGLGPIEAAACGVPSVVWDHAGPRETVVQGVTGFRVEPYSIEKMAERHVELLSDEKTRTGMGKNARKLAKQTFTWERHANRMNAAIQKILS